MFGISDSCLLAGPVMQLEVHPQPHCSTALKCTWASMNATRSRGFIWVDLIKSMDPIYWSSPSHFALCALHTLNTFPSVLIVGLPCGVKFAADPHKLYSTEAYAILESRHFLLIMMDDYLFQANVNGCRSVYESTQCLEIFCYSVSAIRKVYVGCIANRTTW